MRYIFDYESTPIRNLQKKTNAYLLRIETPTQREVLRWTKAGLPREPRGSSKIRATPVARNLSDVVVYLSALAMSQHRAAHWNAASQATTAAAKRPSSGDQS